MPRYKDRTNELTDLLQRPDSIKRIKTLVLYQNNTPVEVGGTVYARPSFLYFQIITSLAEQDYLRVRDLAAGDFSELDDI